MQFHWLLNSLIHVLCNQDVAEIIQGLLDDLFSGENFYKALYFLVHLICKFPAGSDQDGAGQFVMLSLGKKVCCHIAWVAVSSANTRISLGPAIESMLT